MKPTRDAFARALGEGEWTGRERGGSSVNELNGALRCV
jgi:hypothetical protein